MNADRADEWPEERCGELSDPPTPYKAVLSLGAVRPFWDQAFSPAHAATAAAPPE